MTASTALLALIEALEAEQINLGLYSTRLTPQTLTDALAQRQTPRPLAEVEAALRDLVAQGELIEWRPDHFRSRIAETVRVLRLLRQRFWPQKSLAEAALLVEDIRVEFRQRRRPQRQAVSVRQTLAAVAAPDLAAPFQRMLDQLHDDFFAAFNQTLALAFKETPAFRDFLESVILHSLTALLKNLVARLGGVGSDDLVGYADLPLLDQVDRSIDPRILIMDTVEGGSGGIAQAFDRLDLTDNEGSLWWMLQTELGNCPIANGEALIRAVLSRATPAQIQAVQRAKTAEALDHMLAALNLAHPAPAAIQSLGRVLFNEVEVGAQTLNPALILGELWAAHRHFAATVPGEYGREATLCRVATSLDPVRRPHIQRLSQALSHSGVSEEELSRELALQLRAMFESGCDDGCPVCLGSGSDIEHYYLADLLNSRRALQKLRAVLTGLTPKGDSLVELREALLQGEAVHIAAPPGSLSDRLDPALGLAVVAQVDEQGQAGSASTVIVDPARAGEFLRDGHWDERWGSEANKPYETRRGTRVRSRAEYIIATKLEDADLAFEYEPRLAYRDEAGQTRFIHPDFHLFESNLYIEYWGRDDPEYIESRRFKARIYKELARLRGIRVLHLEMDDIEFDAFMSKIQAAIKSQPNTED